MDKINWTMHVNEQKETRIHGVNSLCGFAHTASMYISIHTFTFTFKLVDVAQLAEHWPSHPGD